eukprot:c23563_g1_i2 orf=1016-4003(-)
MVLGLGSRSKKERASAVSQLVELDLHFHEIKPWHGLARPSKAPGAVSLRSSRGEKVVGNSRSLSPTLPSSAELGKIVVGESLRIAVAPNREVLKRAKKSYPDLDKPLVFTLLDVNDLKGKPLAQAALDLSALAAISDPKLVAVPFTVSKKVAKGATTYLHLTVQRHLEDKASGFTASASSATSVSSRTSDASSVPPLDEDTQSMLVAALLSDEEDEVDSFTDDEEDYKENSQAPSLPQGSSMSQGNVTVEPVALPSGNIHQTAANPAIQQIVEARVAPKQPERVDERSSRHAIASPQATPVKAAANAAAAAYAKKHSFLMKDTNSYMDDSDDLYSDADSGGEDEFPSRLSRVVRSQSLLPKGPQTAAGRSQLTSLSVRRSESTSSTSADKSTKMVDQNVVEKAADTNTSGKRAVVDDMQSKLNGEHRTSINLAVSTTSETVVVGRKVGGVEEKVELKRPVNITTTENISTLSLTKERNGSSREPRLEPETFVRTEAGNEKTSGDVNISSQKVEIAQAMPGVDLEKEAEIKHQAKTAVDMKAKAAVRSSFREKGALGPPKIAISKSPDPLKGRTSRSPVHDPKTSWSPVQDSKTSKSTIQEGKARAFKSPDRGSEKGDKKVTVSHAEATAAAAEKKIQSLEAEVEKLKGELRDVAAVEAALYSTTAEHGSSSMKLHAPARRLARAYVYACKHSSQERRASCARNTMSGLVLVARACGNDVPRLTFWWSNATVLREIVSTAFNVLPATPKVQTMAHSSSQSERRNLTSSPNAKKLYQQQQAASPSHDCEDWREPITFMSALERLESWIYMKVVESIWWQVLTPQMQQPIKDISAEVDDNDLIMKSDVVKYEKRIIHSELEDARQGNISVDIWKKAFFDAFERLCPVRRLGVECGCLPMLNKLVLEACVDRLDVAMFNAILRDDEVPTDPVSDPISDVRVLPIPNSSLSFGLGAQLKNAVVPTMKLFLWSAFQVLPGNRESVYNSERVFLVIERLTQA